MQKSVDLRSRPSIYAIIGVVIFIVVFDNYAMWHRIIEVYPLTFHNIGFLTSLAVVFGALLLMILAACCVDWTTKPVLIAILCLSAISAYFLDSFGTIIDVQMIHNTLETNTQETADLITVRLLLYFVLLGILPSIFIGLMRFQNRSAKEEGLARLKTIGFATVLVVASLLPFGRFYASFLREHKPLRCFANPLFTFYSMGKFAGQWNNAAVSALVPIGSDAVIPDSDVERELIILVAGESARADRFSLNGYERQTNPRLEAEDVISFTQVQACGTSTSVSIPCMFSLLPRRDYSTKTARSTHNLLDVVAKAGVHVLWRDNNSDSKGVALRVRFEDYREPETNPVCDIECRDEGMLIGLQEYIDSQTEGDILIVLHQMGNHGPAYYKRYPQDFEWFSPVCATNELQKCNQVQIDNAYDNAIRYTDHFLWKVIELLKTNASEFETVMLYFSDHGESLGEKGLYLHGMPYLMAPGEQKRVPAIMWFGEHRDVDVEMLRQKVNVEFSHDYLFHTVLGLLEIDTEIYSADLDMTQGTRQKL